MSHTFRGEFCVIHYNEDYSGLVAIQDIEGRSLVVSCEDLLTFAAEFVRQQAITKFEGMDWKELLNKP